MNILVAYVVSMLLFVYFVVSGLVGERESGIEEERKGRREEKVEREEKGKIMCPL